LRRDPPRLQEKPQSIAAAARRRTERSVRLCMATIVPESSQRTGRRTDNLPSSLSVCGARDGGASGSVRAAAARDGQQRRSTKGDEGQRARLRGGYRSGGDADREEIRGPAIAAVTALVDGDGQGVTGCQESGIDPNGQEVGKRSRLIQRVQLRGERRIHDAVDARRKGLAKRPKLEIVGRDPEGKAGHLLTDADERAVVHFDNLWSGGPAGKGSIAVMGIGLHGSDKDLIRSGELAARRREREAVTEGVRGVRDRIGRQPRERGAGDRVAASVTEAQ